MKLTIGDAGKRKQMLPLIIEQTALERKASGIKPGAYFFLQNITKRRLSHESNQQPYSYS